MKRNFNRSLFDVIDREDEKEKALIGECAHKFEKKTITNSPNEVWNRVTWEFDLFPGRIERLTYICETCGRIRGRMI